jgi:hypothetical protein
VYKILLSILNLSIWLILIFNFFRCIKEKEANFFVEKLAQKNLINVFFVIMNKKRDWEN